MQVTAQYITGLKQAYFDNDGKETWEHFENIKHGASSEDIASIKNVYPEAPAALVAMLEYVDGTYWREYKGEEIALLFLGSDVMEYPYYLLSAKAIVKNKTNAIDTYSDYIEGEYEGVDIDEKIANQSKRINWLHFSDCMNNGGTSQLFIDFSPSEKGVKGQIVRFLHDPDEFKVIANSFEEYLQMLMDNEYDFVSEDIME